jgi:hypothetical protein
MDRPLYRGALQSERAAGRNVPSPFTLMASDRKTRKNTLFGQENQGRRMIARSDHSRALPHKPFYREQEDKTGGHILPVPEFDFVRVVGFPFTQIGRRHDRGRK